MAVSHLEMQRIISACWDKSCYVIVRPLDKGIKKPPCKLIMSMQGYNKTGNNIYKQNDEMHKKIEEIYLYMYKRLHTLE